MDEYLTENTTFAKDSENFSWASRYFLNPYIGKCNQDTNTGDIFEFKFNGTECAIVYALMPDNVYISVTVDGGQPRYYMGRIAGSSNPKTFRICQGLEKSEHTVRIEVLRAKPDNSSGYNFRIGALLINTDDSAYSPELTSPSLLKLNGTYEDISGLADNDPSKTEWDSCQITDINPAK